MSDSADYWELPLPTSEDEEAEEEERENADEKQKAKRLQKLKEYVSKMAYLPQPKVLASARTEQLAKPKGKRICYTYMEFQDVLQPKGRRKRLRQMTERTCGGVPVEQLEMIIKSANQKQIKKQKFEKHKNVLYQKMLTKLEFQCRKQYLDVLVRKFADYVADLALTMKIPPSLNEPYGRMHRGLFCNILLAIGMQPACQAAMYYNTPEALEYEVVHKLSHALLSLVVKAVDMAATTDPCELITKESALDVDKYLKDRLMCAAAKKVKCARKKKCMLYSPLANIIKKCDQGFAEPCYPIKN